MKKTVFILGYQWETLLGFFSTAKNNLRLYFMPLTGMPATMPHGSCLHPICQMKGISSLHLEDREAQAAPVKPSDLLSTVNLYEVGPNDGNLIKLSNCARFPLVWVFLRGQLGSFSHIWGVIQPCSSRSNHNLKSDQVSLAQLLKQKCITLKVY